MLPSPTWNCTRSEPSTELFNRARVLQEQPDAPAAPPLTCTFRDFVALEQQAEQSEECQRFWRDQLQAAPAVRLPRSAGAPAPNADARETEDATGVGLVSVAISTEVIDGLRRFTHVWWEGPIGCGKSPTLAAMGLYALAWDNEFGAQVYSLAATYSQARIVLADVCPVCFRGALRGRWPKRLRLPNTTTRALESPRRSPASSSSA